MSGTSASTGPAGRVPGLPAAPPGPRRWLIPGTVGLAQLMVVLDATIVNIALPSAQRALGLSTVDRQWVVTAYALAFGSLLLFGGRLGDLIGRKVTFLAGAPLRRPRGHLRHAVPLRPAPRPRNRGGHPDQGSRASGGDHPPGSGSASMEEAMSPTPAAVAILGCMAGTWKADPVRTGIGLSARPLMAGKVRGPAPPAPHRDRRGGSRHPADDRRQRNG